MSVESKIKLINKDDDSLYTSKKIGISSSKSIKTPSKILDISLMKLSLPIVEKNNSFDETFKRITPGFIEKCQNENEPLDKLESWFNSI